MKTQHQKRLWSAGAVPGVWHADAVGAHMQATQPTGYRLLDAELPGNGWPMGAMSEVFQPLAGLHEWQLVLPALVEATAQRAGVVVAVAPPHEPFGPALNTRGLSTRRLCVVQADTALAALWAAEQALRCQEVLAVMAWLPQAQPAALRRLHLAAAQHQQMLWVFRPLSMTHQPSQATLRLLVQAESLPGENGLASSLQVQILKRRGPPLARDLHLPVCHPRLAQVLAAQAQRRSAAQEAAGGPGASHLARTPPKAATPVAAVRVATVGAA